VKQEKPYLLKKVEVKPLVSRSINGKERRVDPQGRFVSLDNTRSQSHFLMGCGIPVTFSFKMNKK